MQVTENSIQLVHDLVNNMALTQRVKAISVRIYSRRFFCCSFIFFLTKSKTTSPSLALLYLKLGGDGVVPTKSGPKPYRTVIFLSLLDPTETVFASARDTYHSRMSSSSIVCQFNGHPADVQKHLIAAEGNNTEDLMPTIVDKLTSALAPLCAPACIAHQDDGCSHVPFSFAGMLSTSSVFLLPSSIMFLVTGDNEYLCAFSGLTPRNCTICTMPRWLFGHTHNLGEFRDPERSTRLFNVFEVFFI